MKPIKLLPFIFSLLFSSPCLAGYTVELANGNVLAANSYRLDKGKVFLKYPVGEAAFPESKIKSIKNTDGTVEMLQVEGRLKPGAQGGAGRDGESRTTRPPHKTPDEAGASPDGESDGRQYDAEALDRRAAELVERMATASDAELEELDKEFEKLFVDFF